MGQMVMACVLALSVGLSAAAKEKGLVGHYTFGEGSESLLRDMSGNGNDGKTKGAKLVKGAAGSALYFKDGDSVSFGRAPALEFTNAVTLTAWAYLTDIIEGDHALVVGRKPHSCGLCEHVKTPYAYWWVTGFERDSCGSMVDCFRWYHMAASFDGSMMKLYLDGALANSYGPTSKPVVDNSGDFSIGSHNFRGLIAEVKVYKRVLSDAEVASQAKSKPGLTEAEVNSFLVQLDPPGPTYVLRAKVLPSYADRHVGVVLDLSDFGEMARDASLKVDLWKIGVPPDGGPLQKRILEKLAIGGEMEAALTDLDLPPGEYEIRAKVIDAANGRLGIGAAKRFTWSEASSGEK